MKTIFTLAVALLLCSACGFTAGSQNSIKGGNQDGPTPTPTPTPTIENWIAPPEFPANATQRTKDALSVLNTYCVSCHSASTGNTLGGGVVNVMDPRQMILAGLVVPGDSAMSPLYDVVNVYWMPKYPLPMLSAKARKAIKDWIDLELTNSPEGIPGYVVQPPVATFTWIRNNIIAPRCLACHGGVNGTYGGANLLTYGGIAGNINRIISEVTAGDMPGRYYPLTRGEVNLLSAWRDAGTPNN